MKILIFFLLFFFWDVAKTNDGYYLYSCKTSSQSGLNFLGKDHDKILKFLGMKNFRIKLERNREDILSSLQLERNQQKKYSPKSSHFIDLTVLKSNGQLEGMNCSWRFDIRFDKLEDRLFNCVDRQTNKNIFNLDFAGNFIYSSSFPEFYYQENNKNSNQALHSIFGKCLESK